MIGCEQTAAPESTVFATNVSGRVKAPDRIPRHSLLSLTAICPSFFLFVFFFFYLVSSIPLPSGFLPPSRNSCSCTLSRIAAILLVSSFQFLFFLALRCHVSLAILRFSFLLSNSPFDHFCFFYFFALLYSFVPFFFSFVFGSGFVIFFALSLGSS